MIYLPGHAAVGRAYAKKSPNSVETVSIEGKDCLRMTLTKGATALLDENDYALVKDYRWWSTNGYAYAYDRESGKSVPMHRVILREKEGSIIDHINRDRLDNRRDNLRVATVRQNHFNLSVRKSSVTGTAGVNKFGKKYRARIGVDGKQIHLGVRSSVQDAVELRKKAEAKYHGGFRG